MNHFKLGAMRVDVTRCQVVDGQEIVNVEPKCMAVLAYLAERAGEVVTQEALFAALWPNQVFSPGSVQRCIAQLRKALNDDAKSPTFIMTHPKRGYSLEVLPEPVKTGGLGRQSVLWGLALFGALLIAVYFGGPAENALLKGRLQPVTSTSHYDFYPTYTPDGERLAFIRQTRSDNQIVTKQTVTGREQVVWRDERNVQSLAWSRDGLTLFYLMRLQGADVIAKLDLTTDQQSELYRYDGQGEVWRVLAAGNMLYFMVADLPVNRAPSSILYALDLLTGERAEILKSSAQFTPYRLAMSRDQKWLAIAGESAQNQVEFRLLNLAQNALSAPFATLPLGFTEIAWHPDGNRILVHHLNKLYWLDLNGEFQALPYNSYLRVFNPTVAPQGHQVVMSQTENDTDLETLDVASGLVTPLVDSSGEDHLASLSPDRQQLAYVSAKSGVQQVLLKRDDEHILVFANAQNLPIYRAPVWVPDGKRLAFSFATSLYVYTLESGSLQVIDMPAYFTSVLDWYSGKNSLLVATKRDNVSFFEVFDLAEEKMSKLIETGVNYSAKLDIRDRIVFFADGKLFWGGQTFSDPLFAAATSAFIPHGKSVYFQSGSSLYKFDAEQITTVEESLPGDSRLLDVFDAQHFVLETASGRRAKIVSLE